MNERGTALVEAIPVIACLLIFVIGVLLATYLLFARAWIQYQGEQALYCLAEGTAVSTCRKRTGDLLESALPWGNLRGLRLNRTEDLWQIDITWRIQEFPIRVQKRLSRRSLVGSRALRW